MHAKLSVLILSITIHDNEMPFKHSENTFVFLFITEMTSHSDVMVSNQPV